MALKPRKWLFKKKINKLEKRNIQKSLTWAKKKVIRKKKKK